MGHKKIDVTRLYIKNDIRDKKSVFIEANNKATHCNTIISDPSEMKKKEMTQIVKRSKKSTSKLIKRKAGQLYVDYDDWQMEGQLDVAKGHQSQLDLGNTKNMIAMRVIQ
jgi:hypothetical protein